MAEARESVQQRHANWSGSWIEVRRVCVCVAVDELDHMRCECKSVDTYMPNTWKKNKWFCGWWSRCLCKVRGKTTIINTKIKVKLQSLTGGGPKNNMSSGQEVWYKYRSVDTCIIMSWLRKLRWIVGNGPEIGLLNMRWWSHQEMEIWDQRCERCLEPVPGDFGLVAYGVAPDLC